MLLRHLHNLRNLGTPVGVRANAFVLVLLDDLVDLILETRHGHAELLLLLLHLDVLGLEVGLWGHSGLLVLLVQNLVVLVLKLLLLLFLNTLFPAEFLDHHGLTSSSLRARL